MKIYMAGPLFSTAELAFNRELASLLRAQGHEVFLPQEHEQRKDLPRAIFESDVRGLDWAEAVVACLDGADPDSGTCWELGYAYAMKKTAIVYRTDFRLFEGTDPDQSDDDRKRRSRDHHADGSRSPISRPRLESASTRYPIGPGEPVRLLAEPAKTKPHGGCKIALGQSSIRSKRRQPCALVWCCVEWGRAE